MKDTEFYIIIPAYQAGKHIERCLHSVLSQDHSCFHAVVIDDGSKDDTGLIADRFAVRDSRVYVIHQSNQGQIMARSAGIDWSLQHCDNDNAWFLFLDADDELLPGSLTQISLIAQENKYDLIFFGAEKYDTVSGKRLNIMRDSASGSIDSKALLYKIVLFHPEYNSLCRKAISKQIMFVPDYSHVADLRFGEDLIQSLDYYGMAQSVYFSREILYRYHMNPESVTHQVHIDNYPIDSTVRRITWEFVNAEKVWNEQELQAYAQYLLDMLANKLRSICCFRVPFSKKASVFDMVRQDPFYSMLMQMDLRQNGIIACLQAGKYHRLILLALVQKALNRIPHRRISSSVGKG